MREGRAHWVKLLHRLTIGAVILAILFGAALLILALKWPFTRAATIRSLENVSESDVQITQFQESLFPPGYIAQGVTVKRDGRQNDRAIANIGKVICRATWPALLTLTDRINRIDLVNVQIYIPAHVPPPIRRHPHAKIKTTVAQLVANGTMLEIAPRRQGGQPMRFAFPRLMVTNIGRSKVLNFQTLIQIPKPTGDLRVSGSVGPLMLGRIADTRIAGSFQLRHADLSGYKAIAGNLSAEGRFQGTVGYAAVFGQTEISNFEVTSSRHSLGLKAEYSAIVDGTNGDVVLPSVQAHFLSTTVFGEGTISGKQGKTMMLSLESSQGRVEDLLRLFVTADRPPLEGPINLNARIVLPPTHEPFIRRVRLEGNFTISEAEFTNPRTQEKVGELSARARGKTSQIKSKGGPEPMTAELEGDVQLRHGIATVPTALFATAGAVAKGSGAYDLTTEAIDFRGKLAIHASLSKAAGGLKSILLKPLDPFFKKGGQGAVLPVRMSGTYSHPVFKVSLTP